MVGRECGATVGPGARRRRTFPLWPRSSPDARYAAKPGKLKPGCSRNGSKRKSDNRADTVAFSSSGTATASRRRLSGSGRILSSFFPDPTDDWEAERVVQVHGDAEQRRNEQRVEGARALARMKARGETIQDIATLGGTAENTCALTLGWRRQRHPRAGVRRERFAATRLRGWLQ